MIIPARFNGPPGSGNGGYSAGVIAEHFRVAGSGTPAGDGPGAEPGTGPHASFEVTLRTPPPLETPLTFTGTEVHAPDGTVVTSITETRPVETLVAPVPLTEAAEAAERYPGFTRHPFPTCYVCGPDRSDGLGIHPGPLPDGRTAAPWTVPDDVTPATVWAALDCPGGWAVIGGGRPYVLGRIAATVSALPSPGSRCVVVGQLVATEKRKAWVRSTVHGPDGQIVATARATWIAIDATPTAPETDRS